MRARKRTNPLDDLLLVRRDYYQRFLDTALRTFFEDAHEQRRSRNFEKLLGRAASE